MPEIHRYHLAPTTLIPNSPLPLLHYKHFFPPTTSPGPIFDLHERNSWTINWIYRYGPTQPSHYHSLTHESMTVLSGRATIRFGAADLSPDLDANTWGKAGVDFEAGGVEVRAEKGDVFIVPAGVAHKTYDAEPGAGFALLTPGRGKGVEAGDRRGAVEGVVLEGFTMMGAYPRGGVEWDFVEGERGRERRERSWGVGRPGRDPVLGEEKRGICGTWRGEGDGGREGKL
ncbi:hypothetical protein BDZ85DRAFT_297692 [Elsinoe ampelina]|uniref:Uncharacterized protein n=1 Tax=Elsinoe ampelina TaxID=302913 RepID=A0A6A6G5M1_9PEZI|nr:hypothetical protein BDZ85DRAFT_297692 [Elsinoe ampelina]